MGEQEEVHRVMDGSTLVEFMMLAREWCAKAAFSAAPTLADRLNSKEK